MNDPMEEGVITLEPLIKVENVTKEFKLGSNTVRALNGLTLSAVRGELVAIVGPSGCGKTTLLNILGALDRPTAGAVWVDGTELGRLSEKQLVQYRRKKVGFVFQAFNLIPNLTALENVMLPMEFAEVPLERAKSRAEELLGKVGMGERIHHRPPQLSGGEQQRVAIARALANDPAILLADEPTGQLDSETGQGIIELLRELAHQEDRTAIVVTHDESLLKHADEYFKIRDGKIVDTSASQSEEGGD